MSRIANMREPYQKAEVEPDNPERLAAVRRLPCCICWEWGMTQNSPTEAHHCKSGRYSNEKTPDSMAIPLCHSHHNKLRPYPGDEEKLGYHNGQETWERYYGPDTDWISWTEKRITNVCH
jgi:hypothetical protein